MKASRTPVRHPDLPRNISKPMTPRIRMIKAKTIGLMIKAEIEANKPAYLVYGI